MRFEVEVDDGASLATLHKARAAWNAVYPDQQAQDMPSFVQALMDRAVSAALQPFGVTTLAAALSKIAELEAANTTLTQEVATPALAIAPTPVTG